METSRNTGWDWGTAILFLLLIWLAFFHKDKYEGQTAQEWFDGYDSAHVDYLNMKDKYDQLTSCINESYTYNSSDFVSKDDLKMHCDVP